MYSREVQTNRWTQGERNRKRAFSKVNSWFPQVTQSETQFKETSICDVSNAQHIANGASKDQYSNLPSFHAGNSHHCDFSY